LEEEYGPNELPFHDGGYASAFDLAKKDLKFLLVVLTSPEHDLTAPFIRDTLLAPDVVRFLRDPANNTILWAGSVSDSEAYSVSTALTCTKFPFSALIVHTPAVSSSAMGIAARLSGPISPSQYLSKLRAAMSTHNEALSRIRAQRAEQTATRTLRQQQDSAYERSLATDRARAQKKKEDAAAQAAAEKSALAAQEAAARYAENLAQWRRWRASTLIPEPSADDKDAVRISIRLPSAERVVRRFEPSVGIEELYAFVECHDTIQAGDVHVVVEKPHNFSPTYSFQLVSPMPRAVYAVEAGGTVRDVVGRSGNLIVETLSPDEDEEEGEEED
jgi:FAS-associated factor 2